MRTLLLIIRPLAHIAFISSSTKLTLLANKIIVDSNNSVLFRVEKVFLFKKN